MVPGNRYDILDMAEISFVYNNNVQYQYQVPGTRYLVLLTHFESYTIFTLQQHTAIQYYILYLAGIAEC